MTNELAEETYSLIIVADGWAKKTRGTGTDAANHFKHRLCDAGFCDREDRRVIAESCSRYVCGVRPNAMDIKLSVLKARLVTDGLEHGHDKFMAYFLAEHDHGLKNFEDVETDNLVEPANLDLIDRRMWPESCGKALA